MHRDSIDRFEVKTISSLISHKRLGTYLIEAGLINEAQVEVALNDQQATGMKFGEVLATRGWVKQQTVEYLMQKVVIPERNAQEKKSPQAAQPQKPAASRTQQPGKPSTPKAKSMSTPTAKQRVAQQDATRRPAQRLAPSRSPSPAASPNDASFTRRDAPITKPLPSVPNGGDEVSWVG